ncbi:MAG: hypothetical protein Q8R16_00825 [bacterium]|nr:hypothetical protein [bacterium]
MVAVETPQESFRKLFTHPLLQGCVLLVLAVVLAVWVQVPGKFPDPDSFYHAGMAELAASGTFPSRFPWLELTTLRDTYADLHFLYHLALVPFVRLFGAMAGLRIATITAVGLFTVVFFTLLRALRTKGAFAFTLLLLGSSAFMFRANLAKAQGFAFVVLFLGLMAIARRSYTGVFLAALFATWTSSHWPVLIVAVAAFSLLHVFTTALGDPRSWRAIVVSIREAFVLLASAMIGVAAGLIVNPYFPGILDVTRDQIIRIALVGGIPEANVGIEWGALSLGEFFRSVGFLLPLLLLAVMGTVTRCAQLVRRQEVADRDRATTALALGILTIAFAVLTLRSRRHIEFFVPFAVLFCAVGMQPVIAWLWPPRLQVGWRRPGTARRALSSFVLVVAIIGFAVGSFRALRTQRQYFVDGFRADHLRGAATWVREHVPAGALVFHADWDDFPYLFLNNRDHRYLIGLDPRFAYFANPDRFRAWARIGRGEETGNVAQRIVDTFGTTHAVVANQQQALQEQLAADRSATVVFEDGDAKVYALTR